MVHLRPRYFAQLAILAFIAYIGSQISNHFYITSDSMTNMNENPDPYPLVQTPPRYYRATDPLSDTVTKIQMIARLATAIHLQQSLINGNIDSAKLVSELLRFGPVTPAQIDALDLEKLESPLNQLKELPASLSARMDELDVYFQNIKSLVTQVDGYKDMNTWPEEADYESDINGIADKKLLNIDAISKLKSGFSDWESEIRRAFEKKDQKTFGAVDAVNIINLRTAIENLLNSTLAQEIPKVFEFKNKRTALESVDFLSSLSKAIHIMETATLSPPLNGINELKEKLADIKNVADAGNNVKQMLDNIRSVFKYRSLPINSRYMSSAEYTTGLPEGSKDITHMLSDFANKWILQVVQDERLSDAFKSMKILENSFNNIEQTLGARSDENSKAIENLVDVLSNLFNSFSTFEDSTADKVTSCYVYTPKQTDQSVHELISNASILDQELVNIGEKLAEVKDLLNENEFRNNLQGLLKATEGMDMNNPDSIKTTFDSFFNFDKLQVLKVSVEDNSKKMMKVDVDKLVELAKKSQLLFAGVKTYRTTKITKNVQFLNCLIQNDAETKSTISVVDNINSLRSASGHGPTIEKALKAAKAVIETKPTLKLLDTNIKGIKGTKGFESDLLVHLHNASVHSKVIGSSMRGVFNLKSVIDLQQQMGVISSQSQLVSDEIRSLARKLAPEHVALLNSFALIGPSLDKFYTSLATWKNDVSSLNVSDLPSLSEVFKKAKTVGGLNQDFGKISESVDQLAKLQTANSKNQKSLIEVRDALSRLDIIGMDFASYNQYFDKSAASLQSLKLFFTKFAQMVSVPPIQKNVPVPQLKSNGSGAPEKESLSIIWWIVIIAVVLLAIVFIYFLVKFLINCCKNRFKQMKKFTVIWATVYQAIWFKRRFRFKIYYQELKNKTNGRQQTGDDAWLRNDRMTTYMEMLQDVFMTMEQDMLESKGCPEQYQEETRHKMDINMKTRIIAPTDITNWIHFKSDFVHANMVKFRNCFRMILTQGPIWDESGKKNTVEKFWWMVKKHKSKAIVMLCQVMEQKIDAKTMELKCSQYFPIAKDDVLTFGGFTIRCAEYEQTGNTIKRTLCYSYKDSKEESVDHYQYIGWPDKSVPKNPEEIFEIWKTVRLLDTPVIAHCSAGVGRTGAFALIEDIYQEVYFSDDGNVDFAERIRLLRKIRARSVQTASQMIFAIRVVWRALFKDVEHQDPKDLKEKEKEALVYKLAVRPSNEPKIDKDVEIVPAVDYAFYEFVVATWPALRERILESEKAMRKALTGVN